MEIAPDINILMSSGFHQDDIDSEILGLGAKGFIRKPYSRAELGKAVADMIGN
jgi:DNA-binding NarL/FixJ family response regulator